MAADISLGIVPELNLVRILRIHSGKKIDGMDLAGGSKVADDVKCQIAVFGDIHPIAQNIYFVRAVGLVVVLGREDSRLGQDAVDPVDVD